MKLPIPTLLLSCIFCLPEHPPTPPNTPEPDIPFAIPVDTSHLPNPRSESEYSLTPAIIEENRMLNAQNEALTLEVARLKKQVRLLKQRVRELEEEEWD